jgi:hypothetical protein
VIGCLVYAVWITYENDNSVVLFFRVCIEVVDETYYSIAAFGSDQACY